MNNFSSQNALPESRNAKARVGALIAILVLIVITLLALIIWASLEKSVVDIFRVLFAERWGIVTLLDLYGGFLISSIWISVLERRALRIVPWIVGILLLGYFTTAIYVLWRLKGAKSVTGAFTRLTPCDHRETRST